MTERNKENCPLPTPRTDAAVEVVRTASIYKDNYCEKVSVGEEMVPAALARTLEWELAAAQENATHWANKAIKQTELCTEALRQRDEAKRALSETPRSVPPGWKLVPVESTEAMRVAARGARPYAEDDGDAMHLDLNTESTWATMLAAAPEAP